MLLWRRIRLEVGHVIAGPFPRRLEPPNLGPFRVPRLAVQIARSAVIEHAPFGRPRPREIRENSQVRGVLRASPLDLRPRLRPTTVTSPVALHAGDRRL